MLLQEVTKQLDCTIITSCEPNRFNHPVSKDYQESVIRLVNSIRVNGGVCRDLPIIVAYGTDTVPKESTLNKLLSLDCEPKTIDTVWPEYPVFNKITACQIPVNTKRILWVDSDIFVLKDFGELFQDKVNLRASPTTHSHHQWARTTDRECWARLFSLFNIDYSQYLPPMSLTHIDQIWTQLYMSSGLVLLDKTTEIHNLWWEIANRILKEISIGSISAEPFSRSFTQVALTLTALKSNCSYSLIEERFHLVYALRGKIYDDTVLVHYQDNRVSEIPETLWSPI